MCLTARVCLCAGLQLPAVTGEDGPPAEEAAALLAAHRLPSLPVSAGPPAAAGPQTPHLLQNLALANCPTHHPQTPGLLPLLNHHHA